MQKKIISWVLMLVGTSGFLSIKAQPNDFTYTQKYTYETLSAYQKKLFDTFLESEVPNRVTIENTLTNDASLRSKTRVAQALLFRNAAGDKDKAVAILQWILKNQYQDENSRLYGIWKTSVANDRFDQNWREFIGCDLIIIRHKFSHLLPQALIKDIETGLIHAAKGAFKRNVGADYTNISIMSAFLMEYVGTAFNLEMLKHAGISKAHDIVRLYQAHQTFSEYNSPTYYGVTLIGLALWRELSFSKEIRTMGKTLEKNIWHEIATLYNPDLRNMPGPHFRGYGMDMKKYFAITGIWISLALDDENLAPLAVANGPKYGEMSNLPTILNLGLAIPEDDLKSLKSFSKPRFITKSVPNNYKGDSIKQVSTMINRDWMMGGLSGNKRVWEQIKTGTIHWKTNTDDVGWLEISGEGNINVKVSPESMFIYTNSNNSSRLEILVYAPDSEKNVFNDQVWRLAGISLATKTALTPAQIEKISKPDFNKYAIADEIPWFYKIVYEIPANWNLTRPLLEITPHK
jgi:hypothetical protein